MNTYLGTKKRALLAGSISVFLGIFITVFISQIESVDINLILPYIFYQNINKSNAENFLPIICCLMTYLILIFPLSNIISNDLQICSVYMFTRYDSRKMWYFKKTVHLFLFNFLACSLYFLAMIVTLVIRGAHFHLPLYEFSLHFLNVFLLMFMMSLFVNIMSIKLPTHFAFLLLTGSIVILICLTLIKQINIKQLYNINPINNYFYIWKYETPNLINIIAQLIILLILFVIGLLIITSADLSTIDKDYT